MIRTVIAISNHGTMLGGGEHSYLDLLSHLPMNWKALAVVPHASVLADKLKKKDIETKIIPLPPIRPWFIASILSNFKKYLNLCRKYRPTLIYTNGSRAAFYGGIIGRILEIPTIWHCRIAEPDLKLDFFLARLVDRIIVNTKRASNRFQQHFHPKVKAVYNGVDIEWLRDGTDGKPELILEGWKTILMVARVSKSKRHDLALLAFEKVAQSDPKVHLVFLGARNPINSAWWDHLQEKTSQSPFSNRIHWVGEVEDVRPWYRAATLSILPTDMESFGRVLIEAMACGVPVVATRCGGIPEIVRHLQDGLLVSPGNADEISEAMIKILEDRTMRERFSRNAQRRAQDFSLDGHVANMIDVFEDTIRR